MQILSRFQSGLDGILGNVALEKLELFRASHQVVEAYFLPQSSTSTELTVDLRRGVLLPGVALGFHFRATEQARQQVNMIGHDDEIAQMISVAIEVA
jgi:hypothetical protein